jgi:hypothetical protein
MKPNADCRPRTLVRYAPVAIALASAMLVAVPASATPPPPLDVPAAPAPPVPVRAADPVSDAVAAYEAASAVRAPVAGPRSLTVASSGETAPPPAPAAPAAPYVFVDDGTGDVDVRFFAAGFPTAYLGVQVVELTAELCRHFGVDADAAVLVSKVTEDGPAAEAGIRVGDVLTAIDGKPIRGSWDLRRQIARREAEEIVLVDLVRDGRPDSVRATLAARENVPRVDLGRLRPLDRLPRADAPGMPIDPDGNVIVWGEEQRRAFEKALEGLREGRVLERLEEAEAARQRAHADRMRALEDRQRELIERLRELERSLAERDR